MEEIEAKKDGEAFLVLLEFAPTVDKKRLRKNIFRSIGTVYGQHCILVIDAGSCENIISQTLVDRLKLKVYNHNRVKWLMKGDGVQVRHTCQVPFAIGENCKDTIWCEVLLPMDSGDILLGRL